MNKEILKTALDIEDVMNNEEDWDAEFFTNHITSEVAYLIDLIKKEGVL